MFAVGKSPLHKELLQADLAYIAVGALCAGTRVVLYDGSPFHPDVREFLRFASAQG